MTQTSVTLLDRLKHGRQVDDWTRFVAIYQPFIHRYIKLDAALTSDADDICQEVLQKIIAHLPSFERIRDGSFRCWLRTITVNEVRLFWRRRMRKKVEAAALTQEQIPLGSLADPVDVLSQQWDREHELHVLARLLDLVEPEFSPTTWSAFCMRVMDELPSEVVAARLQITRNAVDIAKSRVLARLRKESAGFLD